MVIVTIITLIFAHKLKGYINLNLSISLYFVMPILHEIKFIFSESSYIITISYFYVFSKNITTLLYLAIPRIFSRMTFI